MQTSGCGDYFALAENKSPNVAVHVSLQIRPELGYAPPPGLAPGKFDRALSRQQ